MKGKGNNRAVNFVRERPRLQLSSAEYHFRIPEGSSETATLRMRAEDGSRIAGLVTSDNRRIVLAIREFSGATCEVLFGIDINGLSHGNRIEGAITISSNLEERAIPVSIEVIEDAMELSEPEVATLEDFARACSGSMREGFRLFTSPAFPTLLDGKNRVYLALYKGMAHNPVTYQHLEEFLVTTGKKQPIELSIDKQEKAAYHLDASQKDTLYIYRSTWGYIRLEIEIEGDFLEVEKKVVTSDDFIGRVYGLEYIVKREKLGEGKNFGRILIHSVHQELEFLIEAARGEEQPIRTSTVRRRKISWLMRDYLKLLLHELDYRSWYDRSTRIVTELREEDPADAMAILYDAFLAYSQDDNARAMELLWPIKEEQVPLEDNEQKALYLYLAKAVDLLPREKSDIRGMLQAYQKQEPVSWLILQILQREEDPAGELMLQKMEEMEACFRAGCSSPFLYLEACGLLEKEESLLRRLTPFMTQTLRFAQGHGRLPKTLLLRAAYLSSGLKEFSGSVYRLLVDGYEAEPDRDVLEAICKLIMLGDASDPAYFHWYELAVREELRITRLYEYYVETFPGTSRNLFPLPVRMYFAYNNTLGEKSKALLYASIILHREDDSTSYLNYAKTMQRFALESLRAGRIDENYAIIYQHILVRPESRLAAEELARVLFARKLVCRSEFARNVIVCHNAFQEEATYPIRDGVAYPRIYSEDACILFEDDKQRRFCSTVDHDIQKLFEEKEIAWACAEQGLDDAGLELYLCKEKAYQMDVNSHTLPVFRMAVRNESFTDEYRDILRRKLTEYYLDNADDETAQEFLDQMDPITWAAADKASLASLLILEGQVDDAFRVIAEYGYEGIQPELLLRLASRLILREDHPEEEELLCLAEYVFGCGKYDEIVLNYLRDHMEGNVQRLGELWERIMGFQLDRGDLDEKILKQAIFTHTFPKQEEKILWDHVRKSGFDQVTRNYLVYVSEHFFLEGRKTDDAIFRMIEKMARQGEPVPLVCKLALLKQYSVQVNRFDEHSGAEGEGALRLTAEQEELLREFLRDMNEEGLRFEFFGRLPAKFIQAYQLEDKVFVEERFRETDRVVLHYRLAGNGHRDDEWKSEPLTNAYGGIFVKEFLLFYGETLTYYMSVMEEGAIQKTETVQLSLVDMDTFGNTRYKLLNRMLEARAVDDTEAEESALAKYLEMDSFADRFLQLL